MQISQSPKFSAQVSKNQWIQQFTPEDRQTAEELHDEINYYDLEKTRKALKKLHNQLVNDYGITPDNTNFMAVGKYKSGSVLGYLYRQVNHFPFTPRLEAKKSDLPFIEYSEFKKQPDSTFQKDNLVLIDDGIFSGQDLSEYFNQYAAQFNNYKNVYVVVLTATKEGLTNIEENAKTNNQKPPIVIYDRLLSSIYDNPDKASAYRELNEKYHTKLPERLEELQHKAIYPVAYAWNAPIRCPSLLTYNYDGIWDCVYERYWGQPTTQRGEMKPDRGEGSKTTKFDQKA
jgi:hypothetical protein